MKTISTLLTAAALSASLLIATNNANATLIDQGATVYDNDLGISWLKNANLAASDTFGVGGINAGGTMSWNTAQSWIGAMNTDNYQGYSDWRLPTSDTTCAGYNCTGSEMGHLFYTELGGAAGSSITTTHNANYSLFSNLQSNGYWSGTEYAPSPTSAWDFYFSGGVQLAGGKNGDFFALAVRPGQAGAAVPEPAGLALFGIGLLGLMAGRRRLALR